VVVKSLIGKIENEVEEVLSLVRTQMNKYGGV